MTSGVAVIVPCRVESSRLPNKALVPLDGIPAIERCLHNCLRIPGIGRVILATTEAPADDPLEDHLLDGAVDFWRGSTDDVILRFLGACDAYNLHTVIRITGDCPAASWEIADLLLREHISHGADCTMVKTCAVGTSGDVFSVDCLRRIHRHFGQALYSEYMSWYFTSNPDVFTIRTVELPASWVRDYRLTLDYDEDAEMFSRLFRRLREEGWAADIDNVFRILDREPSIPALNAKLPLKYRDDTELIRNLRAATTIKGDFV